MRDTNMAYEYIPSDNVTITWPVPHYNLTILLNDHTAYDLSETHKEYFESVGYVFVVLSVVIVVGVAAIMSIYALHKPCLTLCRYMMCVGTVQHYNVTASEWMFHRLLFTVSNTDTDDVYSV